MHKELEARLAAFLGTDDTILYSSCFDANGGLFETILDEQDAVISDALNHASIIDGIRLCKARRLRYDNNDMAQLEQRLQEAADARYRLIATDGVFSMDGVIADLPAICDLADQYDAMVMVDDSHAVGFVGDWRPRHARVLRRDGSRRHHHRHARQGAGRSVRRLHGGRREVIDWLRQRSRPYLFSNSLAPVIAATTLQVLDLLEIGRRAATANSSTTRSGSATGMAAAGFTLAGAGHPIIPVMLGDARVAAEMAERLLDEGIYVIAFSFPVVPKDTARIRTQMSAAHTDDDIDQAIAAFTRVGTEMGVIVVKALVKATTRTRAVARGRRSADTRRRDVLIRVRKTSICGTDLHIHQWDALGAGDHPGADGRRPRVHGRDRRARRRCGRPRSRPAGRRRGPHHVRPLPQLQGRATRVLPQPHRRRRHPAGRVRRVRGAPGPERVLRTRPHRRQRRRRARSARQRDAHVAALTTSSARTC